MMFLVIVLVALSSVQLQCKCNPSATNFSNSPLSLAALSSTIITIIPPSPPLPFRCCLFLDDVPIDNV